jgi:hypothetical protein
MDAISLLQEHSYSQLSKDKSIQELLKEKAHQAHLVKVQYNELVQELCRVNLLLLAALATTEQPGTVQLCCVSQ